MFRNHSSLHLRTIFLLTIFFTLSTLFSPFTTFATTGYHWVTAEDYQSIPPFVTMEAAPLLMLVMGRDHKLYYEAYNDASDLDGDGGLDVGYKPDEIEYYGYFDSYKYYTYSDSNNRFEPAGVTDTATDKTIKKVPSSGTSNTQYWSGDFLNYLTMSRMDCLRKVLYGGYRSTDTVTETVLQRVYIPQDAHSWGKEYKDEEEDGYDINDYAPLEIPRSGTRHLFSCTTLSDNGEPILRVLPNNTHRIWEWVAKERPVCDDSLESSGSTTITHPSNASEYQMIVDATDTFTYQGQSTNNIIDSDNDNLSDSNPYDGDNEKYLNIFTGKINVTTEDTYWFSVDGDDAVELLIDGEVVIGWYGGHGKCGSTTSCRDAHKGSINLTVGEHNIEFRHEEWTGGDNYYLYWNQGDNIDSWEIVPEENYPGGLTQKFYEYNGLTLDGSTITDYSVRVKVCDPNVGLEDNSKRYPEGNYKPTGLLQTYGEANRMLFGLMTGSYKNNLDGGVLRKNIGSIKDEIDEDTGQFTTTNGIISTINKLRIIDYDYSDHAYDNCGWVVDGPLDEVNKDCTMWGNPIGEMMYEALRYFAGEEPTSDFTYSSAADKDDAIGLTPPPSWNDPYSDNAEDTNNNGTLDAHEDIDGDGEIDSFGDCAKPFMLVLSDINPNFDGDASKYATDFIDVTGLAQTISDTEIDATSNYFIGQSGSEDDGACTEKTITGFDDISGLCPEEPTKKGSYFSAAVAYHGLINDISDADGDQNVTTYCVALASPIPEINIKVGDSTITLVPFGKSVGGYGIASAPTGPNGYQPTNTIVDFFVDREYGISDTLGKFRINFEDVEQGADHDMDAIVEYTYHVVDSEGNWVGQEGAGEAAAVKIELDSTYAAGSIIQHMGYIISGTTEDGTYLEVMDQPGTSEADYYLDTPNTVGENLPLSATRTFYPGTSSASLLKNPLWYAAKWGAFNNSNGGTQAIPDIENEWDSDNNGEPDTYFYVQNPLTLEQKLNKAFADILQRTSSGTAASVISQSKSGEGSVYQAIFYPGYIDDSGNTITWIGNVHALFVDSMGNMREDTNHNQKLDIEDSGEGIDKIIVFNETDVEKYSEVGGTADAGGPYSIDDIAFLWQATDWLNNLKDDGESEEPSDAASKQRTSYASTDRNRYIFTFVDTDGDMIADDNEVGAFKAPDTPDSTPSEFTSKFLPYLNIFPLGMADPEGEHYTGVEPTLTHNSETKSYIKFKADASDGTYEDFLKQQHWRVINYIRGQDQSTHTSDTIDPYILPAFRNRQIDTDNDGNLDSTWRLGDIVYSTPSLAAAPSENYHLLYNDPSYGAFLNEYKNRRHVIYAGANDGMFHAFNGGFYDSKTKSFNTTGSEDETAFELGAELWAYIPFNLLPHLYWLTDPDYPHVYYCDLQPKIFDAKIKGTATDPEWGTFLVGGMRLGGGMITADENKDGIADGDEQIMKSAYFIFDITNPEAPPELIAELSLNEMGYTTSNPTVVPMQVIESYSEGTAENDWYLVFGSGPADGDGNPPPIDTYDYKEGEGQKGSLAFTHFLSEQPGKIFVVDLKALVRERAVKVLSSGGILQEITPDGQHYFEEFSDNASFIADPVTIDVDMDFSADMIYFGTVEADISLPEVQTGSVFKIEDVNITWNGKLRSMATYDNTATEDWTNQTLISTPGQPITAEPNATLDDRNKLWIYFGTGRYFVKNHTITLSDADNDGSIEIPGDEDILTQQSYYGVIQPFDDEKIETEEGLVIPKNTLRDDDENFNWDEEQEQSDLLDATSVKITQVEDEDDGTISYLVTGLDDSESISNGFPDINENNEIDWEDLVKRIDDHTLEETTDISTYGGGWYMDFTLPPLYQVISEGERNISQAALFGELLSFTAYIPGAVEKCEVNGDSNLYALYYKTGTSYYEPSIDYQDSNGNGTIDEDETTIEKMLSLGSGLAGTPNIHAGEQEGSTAFIQTSTGDIITIPQINPYKIDSGVQSWKEGSAECE